MAPENQLIDFEKGSVEESLFIPLIVKANETTRKDSLFTDTKAKEIIENINQDFSRFEGGNITYHGILVRTTVIDNITTNFLKRNPEGVIINLGAGLDTRINRIDTGKSMWYDIDFPEVIELRKKFFKESERAKFISKSLLDLTWVNDLDINKNSPVLIIAEGLLMYFSQDELKTLFEMLIEKFQNAEMCFDVIHKFFVGKGVSSKFKWGIEKAQEIEQINSNIRLIEHWSTGDHCKDRQELLYRIMNIFPGTRNRSQVLLIRL